MKVILLNDLEGNEFTISTMAIVSIIENENLTIVETTDGNITVQNSKQAIENAINNCNLS